MIHDDANAQCPGLAMYINAHFQMVGLYQDDGDIRYCYAKADGTCTYGNEGGWHTETRDFPIEGHSSPTTHDDVLSYEKLRMVDGEGRANNYEATCYYGNLYYYLNGNYEARGISAEDVVTTCFYVDWYYHDGWAWQLCSEVPWP